MKAYEIFCELTKVGGWSTTRRTMRWAAARYYAGVDSLEQLRALAQPQEVREGCTLSPTLTSQEVAEIIMLR